MHITSVLFNLIDNAIKYSVGIPVLKILLAKENNFVILKISDKGKGIPVEFRHKIFEKFFRVPHGDAYEARGYGLGLSYVMHILRGHNGSIEVQSELGEGSTFTVKIPAA